MHVNYGLIKGGRMYSRSLRTIALIVCVAFISGCTSIPALKTRSHFDGLYRRIAYKTEGDYRVVNIFYATSQKADKEKDTMYFRPEMGRDLTYGLLDIKINPRVRIGKMTHENLKRRGIIGVQDIRQLESDAFINDLTKAVKASPHHSLFVLIFGFKDSFRSTAVKAAYFSYLLDVNTPVLLFGWPGDQSVSISGYKKARTMATASGPYLGELLTKIIRKVKPKNLWVQGSSLGCQVVCDAFEYMYKYDDLSDRETEISHVLLAAPDVAEDEFDHNFKDELLALSNRLTAYVSSDDNALLLSELIDHTKKLGRQTSKKHEQLEEAKDLLYLKTLNPDKFSIIDVTPINTASYRHGYYLEDPSYFDDVYIRVLGEQDINRRLYLLKAKDKTDYWVLRSE